MLAVRLASWLAAWLAGSLAGWPAGEREREQETGGRLRIPRELPYHAKSVLMGTYVRSHFNTYPATILYWGERARGSWEMLQNPSNPPF